MRPQKDEQRICDMTAAGFTNAEIATVLGVSIDCVKARKKVIYRRLEIGSKMELRRIIQGDPVRLQGPGIKKRDVYRAYRAQGVTYKEISRLEGVKPDSVKTYLWGGGNDRIR